MANAFLAAKGYEVGASKGGGDEVDGGAARSSPMQARSRGTLVVPTDVVVAREAVAGAPSRIALADGIAADEMALDIGPQTTAEFVRAAARRGDHLLERADGRVRDRRVRGGHEGRRRRRSPAASP